ncbi:MAG TPA: hypothetical protein VKS19_11485 [Verrucomicrobiae bacterium]|nr:hypothetical protein [Verrucomicrobiae bacterium]
MKSRHLFKDIFTLAVRLLGLVFLYLGLSAVPPLLDFGALETAAQSDIVTAILPIVFNLAVAWWLLGGELLIRRAYPEARGTSIPSPAQREDAVPATTSPSLKRTTEMEAADKKLASLVEKPKGDHAA